MFFLVDSIAQHMIRSLLIHTKFLRSNKLRNIPDEKLGPENMSFGTKWGPEKNVPDGFLNGVVLEINRWFCCTRGFEASLILVPFGVSRLNFKLNRSN